VRRSVSPQAAIEALGYVPDPAARQLRGGRSGVMALAVPELLAPYFAELAVDLLAERLGDGPAATGPPRELRVDHRLVARESTLGGARRP